MLALRLKKGKMMPKFAVSEITDDEAVQLLRKHIANLKPDPPPKFKPGTAVRLDNGCVGVVCGSDYESTLVYYISEEGVIEGPEGGYHLERL